MVNISSVSVSTPCSHGVRIHLSVLSYLVLIARLIRFGFRYRAMIQMRFLETMILTSFNRFGEYFRGISEN